MANGRVLVTGAAGKIGGAVTAQLLERGVATRALVRREDVRSAHLRSLGANTVVADMFDVQQVQAALEGVDRLFFNLPYHPHALDIAVTFAVAARRAGVEAVVALGQWLASPEHPSLMTRHHWLSDKLFQLLPDTAHIAVDPGFFADNCFQVLPFAAQLGVLPIPTGGRRNAPPSNEDIARVVVGALLDPHPHDGRAYRPTGPKLLSGSDIADAIGDALGRPVRHIDIPPRMFMRAVRVGAKQLGADMYFQSGLRHYLPENALGIWEVGGPTTHVRDVAGVEPEDFLTIARRYVSAADTRRTAGHIMRQIGSLMLTSLVPMHRLDKFDRRQQHPQPAHPRYSGESAVWRDEHTPSAGSTQYRFGDIEADISRQASRSGVFST
ncbi:putative nucleoside-diphosphate sugar epimerase [Mycobacterium sp. JS623]|uniref:NmrA family NAD(P)-binding protein n=1 Tax=Mycobacterium sp. JS623 TaxID=212767 RepID=UPI0002A59D2B|nr:NmrA family NAD(P)-binding protein [Mycobacterium sp. JS623]AGB21562.1 putative nucleoside-diphosphate sugar epimerase [Mycobacterium sp. JS623]